jgi:5-amino-6-(5-phosphoribosylamino)uracil reductase
MKVILSAAVSLDGFLDDTSSARLRLSSDEDWEAVRRLRAACDAILVGAGTVRSDNPSLVIDDERLRRERIGAGMDPDIIKVAVSRSGNLDPHSRFFTEGAGRKILFTCGPVAAALERAADIVVAPEITAQLICAELESRGCKTLMVEGGSTILTMFLEEGAVDEFRLAVAPMLLGRRGGARLVSAGTFPFGNDHRLKPVKVELLGDTTVMHFKK